MFNPIKTRALQALKAKTVHTFSPSHESDHGPFMVVTAPSFVFII
jgi:hypothetical protein